MNAVSYYELLRGAASLCGLDQDNIATDEEQILRQAISRRIGMAWEAAYWPDIAYIQKRTYRPTYSASETLAAATLTTVTERYFPQTDTTYQALRNMPLTVNTITRVGTTATATTAGNHLLITGDQVTISGANETQYNITATVTVTAPTTFTYVLESDPGGSATGTLKCGPNPAQFDGDTMTQYWAECQEDYGAQTYVRTLANAIGSQVYYPPTNRSYQCYATAAAGFLPTNTTYFAPLTDFDRYIALEQTGETKIGDVVGVYSKSPVVWRNAETVDYYLSPDGIQVLDDWGSVWVEFKAKVPVLIGDTFSSTSTYAANLDQVYYRSTTSPSSYPGNMYDCITTTSPGDSPESAAAKWSVVNIPRLFQRYIERGAYADYLIADGDAQTAMVEDQRAGELLAGLVYRVAATENQTRPTVVLTR